MSEANSHDFENQISNLRKHLFKKAGNKIGFDLSTVQSSSSINCEELKNGIRDDILSLEKFAAEKRETMKEQVSEEDMI